MPFQRLGTERTRQGGGHGLGLAIVRVIADVHGATLAVQARPEGGLDIQVRLRLAPGEPAEELGDSSPSSRSCRP